MNTIVIHDSKSTYSDNIAKLVDKIDDVNMFDYRDENVQNFLEKQFSFKPNCLFVIEDDRIYAGDHATDHLMSRQGVPNIVSGLLRSKFDDVSKLLSFVTEDSDGDIHGEFPIREDAKEIIEDIQDDSSNTFEIPINES